MDEELKKRILDDIDKNGYLQEMKVGSILEEQKFYVSYNRSYADPESGKAREIDVFGIEYIRADEFNETSFAFRLHLVIEVKYSQSKPWVFFCKENNYLQLDYLTANTVRSKKLNHTTLNFYKEHPRYKIDYKANNYYEAFRKSSDETVASVYKAIMSVCNATHYFTSQEKGNIPGKQTLMANTDPGVKPEIVLYVPIVVFDGTLTRGYYKETEFILEQTGYVTLDHTMFYNSEGGDDYPVDIVHIDYLSTYLIQLREWAENTKRMMKKNREENK